MTKTRDEVLAANETCAADFGDKAKPDNAAGAPLCGADLHGRAARSRRLILRISLGTSRSGALRLDAARLGAYAAAFGATPLRGDAHR